MSELPTGWRECKISDVAKVVGGGTPPSKDELNFTSVGGVPWITPADLSGFKEKFIAKGARNLSERGYQACGAVKMPPGTVLFSSRAPIGYVAIAESEIATNQGFKSLVLPDGVSSAYTFWFMRHIKPLAEHVATGTTFKELSGAATAKLPFLLPPSAEQKRIAAKLDSVFARVDAARARLERVPAMLKRFRQAVLMAAISGKLTAEWRLARNLQEDWKAVTLSEVASDFAYGTSAKSLKEGIVPVLRMGNIQNGKIDWGDLLFTSDEAEIVKYRVQKGDVLFNRTNSPELVGKSAVFKGEREAVYAGYLIRVRCSEKLLPDYLNYCLASPYGRDYCWRVKTDGVSQSNINAKKLAAFEFGLPSIDEQREIVERAESLFAIADKFAAQYERAVERVDKLTPALLAKAFRGELVPQDPNDEPAEKLLERLKALTTSLGMKSKRSKRSATAAEI